MKKQNKSWVKVFYGGLGTLVMAWIGQYLYDIINLETKFNNVFSSIGYLFTDYPYINAVTSYNITVFERYGYLIASGIFGASITMFVKALKAYRNKSKNVPSIITWAVITISTVIVYFYCVPISTVYTAVYREKNNLEIVKPYISNQEYDLLISNLYQIESKKDYEKLVDDVKKIANENNLILQ